MPNTYANSVYICVYVLFSVVEYFLLTYVWVVLENAGFVQVILTSQYS